MKILLLNLLLIIPIIGFYFIKIHEFKLKYTVFGILLGSIISPLSLGLYSMAFLLPYIGIVFLIFMPVNLFFSKPAWWLLVKKLSLIDGINLSLYDHLYLSLLNGLIWATLFSLIGLFFDIKSK